MEDQQKKRGGGERERIKGFGEGLSPAIKNQDSIPDHKPVDMVWEKKTEILKEEESEEERKMRWECTSTVLRQYKKLVYHRAIIGSPGIIEYNMNTIITLLRG